MATLAATFPAGRDRRDRFFSSVAIAMALTVVVAFGTNFLVGRSSFGAPPIVHLHAVAFMGWVALFTLQAQLGAGAETPRLHRRLGWIGAGWAGLLVVMGCAMTVFDVRMAHAPFFFRPQHFLFADPFTVFAFAGFTAAAVRLRRRTDWHRRLHICGMSMIMGPAFGRLLPAPLFGAYAFDIPELCGLIFILAGMANDRRRSGRVHPAWWWGVAVMPLTLLAARGVAFSPVGDALYRAVTQGTPGSARPGRAFGPTPPGLRG